MGLFDLLTGGKVAKARARKEKAEEKLRQAQKRLKEHEENKEAYIKKGQEDFMARMRDVKCGECDGSIKRKDYPKNADFTEDGRTDRKKCPHCSEDVTIMLETKAKFGAF